MLKKSRNLLVAIIILPALIALIIPGDAGAANHAPVAKNQSVTTSEDTAKAITLAATDADGDKLTYQIVTQPAHGTLSGTPPKVTYTPNANYNGSDSFTFKANDGKMDSNIAKVSITVTSVNDPPVAQSQSVTTKENTAKAITLAATDADGDKLTYKIVAQPAHGTLSGPLPNVTYTPKANYNGSDSFTFKANDGKLDGNIATVSITVIHINHPPVAQDQSVTTNEDTAKAITLVATDVDGNKLTYKIVAQPDHGTLSGTLPNVTYTPSPGYYGSDSFTFSAYDGLAYSNVATVSITVTHVIMITTVAGNGLWSYGGDNGPATKGRLMSPSSVAVDASGNLYIVDSENNRIRKVDTNGIITTMAGNGEKGYGGDGGPATQAMLSNPSGVAVDPSGNLYIADTENLRVRKVNKNGIITTVAGNGFWGNSDDGTPATQAKIPPPSAVAVDSLGNLYIAQEWNNRIRKVDTNGIITTVAGNLILGNGGYGGDGGPATQATLNRPSGVAVNASGNLYIADTDNRRIRKVDKNGIITTVAGNGIGGYSGDGGPATQAQLVRPSGVTVDASGNFYIADTSNDRIRKVDTKGIITTVAGNGMWGYGGDGGPATQATLNSPSGVTVDPSGNLYIADTSNDRIRKVDTKGIITTVAGNDERGDGGLATDANLRHPSGVDIDGLGNLYIADQYSHRIRKVDTKGIITTVAGNGKEGYFGDAGPGIHAQLDYPSAVAVDVSGSVYIADSGNNRIRTVDTNGIITTVAGNGLWGYGGDGGLATQATLNYLSSVAIDASGNLYIADEWNNRIRKVDKHGIITTVAGNGTSGYSGDGGPATQAQLHGPSGVAVDGFSDLYIADSGNNRIRKVDANGIITTVAGNGEEGWGGDGGPATQAQLDTPCGMAIDILGNLYIADYYNYLVRKVDTKGIITTVAGGGNPPDDLGDGGPPTEARLDSPLDVAVDVFGNLYVADFGHHRIRMVKGVFTSQSKIV